MKTPREILLRRHRSVEPKLDQIRQHVLREHVELRPISNSSDVATGNAGVAGWIARLWMELVWPCRRVWLGLGASWVVILIVHVSSTEEGMGRVADLTPLAPSAVAVLKEQRRLIVELTEPSPTSEGAEPVAWPRPRTDLQPSRLGLA